VLCHLPAGCRQEFGSRERIEVEHLGPGELSVANLVEPQNWRVKPPAGAIAPAVIVIDLGRGLGVALLDRLEYLQDHIDRTHR
jgi:hypothetical protein